MSACLTFNIEYCIKTPFLSIISRTFSHILNPLEKRLFLYLDFQPSLFSLFVFKCLLQFFQKSDCFGRLVL